MSKKALHDIDREANEIVEDSLKDFALGTPATRAQTIERLINVKYIKREGRKLVPTEKGKILIDLLQKISSSLTSPQLTGQVFQCNVFPLLLHFSLVLLFGISGRKGSRTSPRVKAVRILS